MSRARVVVLGSVAFASLSLGCGHDEPEAMTSAASLNNSPKLGDFVIEAENSVHLDQGGSLIRGGDVGARGTNGPFLSGGAAIDVDPGTWVTQNVIARSVRLDRATVVGGVQTNDLDGGNRGWHGRVGPFVALPALPAVVAGTPGTTNLSVGAGKTVSASPGAFAAVSVGNGGKLRLAAGSYDMTDLTLDRGARVEAKGAVEIHIANRLATKSNAYLGPASGSSLSAKDVRVHVSGRNGGNANLNAGPKAAAFGDDSEVEALVLAPNGTLVLGDGTEATGAFMARDVEVGGAGTRVTFADGFKSGGGGTPMCPASCDDGNPCTIDACSSGACTHAPAASGTSCSDGNACNGAEVCNGSGNCQAGTPVTCAAPDQCHTAGVCDPSTGVCSNPAKANGAACSDGDACTQTDSCQAGACVGANPVTCTAADQCHAAGVCNPSSGICSNPARPDGSACSDSNACTQTDSCQAGACVGANPVVCGTPDQCHLPGTCDTFTGSCNFPAKADGSSCSDGNSCTGGDSCQAGMCVPGGASCDSIEIVELAQGGSATPQMTTTIASSVTQAVPGDAITITSNVTNVGTVIDIGGEIHLTNKGATTFTVAGYQQTLEYFSVDTHGWVPFAKLAYDGAGNPVPDPSLLALSWVFVFPPSASPGVVYSANPVVGTTIAAGATAAWQMRLSPLVPGNIAATIFDPTKASALRSAIRFDTTSGPVPAPGAADLAAITAGVTGAIPQPAVSLVWSSFSDGGTLLPATPGPIAPGATVAFSAPVPAPRMAPKDTTETDAAYQSRLSWATFFGYFVTAVATAPGTPTVTAAMGIGLALPVISISGAAPTLGGGMATYDVTLNNGGNATAGPFTVGVTVDGMSVPATVSVPATIDPGLSAMGTVAIGAPMSSSTTVLSVTWQDRNGSNYGPVSFTAP